MYLKSVVLVSFCLLSFVVQANPIILTDYSHESLLTFSEHYDFGVGSIISAAIVALSLELLFLIHCFKSKGLSVVRLLIVFLLIHIITFPMVQYYGRYVGVYIEFGAILIETVAYTLAFDIKSSGLKKWRVVSIANFISWLVGFIWLGFLIDWQFS